MLDFLKVDSRPVANKVIEIYPKFIARPSKDLMIRGGDFYSIWNEKTGFWSMSEHDAIMLIDDEISKYADKYRQDHPDRALKIMYLWDTDTKMIDKFHHFVQSQMRDCYEPMNEKLIFANDERCKTDYATHSLDYSLIDGPTPAYDELMNCLYSKSEQDKINWAIGSVVSGHSKKLQKFFVLYGQPGTGKSTILNIIQRLFTNYWTAVDASDFGSNNAFSLETLKKNTLIALQHDADLSRIESNARLNSIVSHETMTINEKHKSPYPIKFISMLFMGTNKPVKITDAKSGLIRRLIDITPTGKTLSRSAYERVMSSIEFELGAIASKCKNFYLENKRMYDDYKPKMMMDETNTFYSFVSDNYFDFKESDSVTLTEAWTRYKAYCDDSRLDYRLPKSKFKNELKDYFEEFFDDFRGDGTHYTNFYRTFRKELFSFYKKEEREQKYEKVDNSESWIDMKETTSIFDKLFGDYQAQYANQNGTPISSWDRVATKLSDINTSRLHYVMVPENHIVIDFDIKNRKGEKDRTANLEAASKWPKTYAEFSKSGAGIHLHYIFTGEPTKLSRVYDDNIEIKVFSGKSSLRRMLTKCNDMPIANISSGLPMRGEKMLDWDGVKSEKMLRTMIKKNLNKEYHGATKPSVDYINKLLDDAYSSELHYDVTDLRSAVLAFANNSTHNAQYCISLVNQMKFRSEDTSKSNENYESDEIVFYDVEVFPNLFLVNWKYAGSEHKVIRMINPTPSDIEKLTKHRLVGFNNRRYDNHMLYGCLMGYSNEQIFRLSQKLVGGNSRDSFFGEAYNLSYADVYDFSSVKKSLKKWEIELGIHHQELGLPWDKPVPKEMWEKVAKYCDNDVIATEAVFNHLKQDFVAREILSELSGLSINDTTRLHVTKFIFGDEKHPKLEYTNLEELFPGYEFKDGKNMYLGEEASFGGYVYAEPGMYRDVALLDVESLHPHSIIAMNVFGEYTAKFKEILDARIAIKHEDYAKAKGMLGGILSKYLESPKDASALSYALKIIINSVYGYTSATFDNPFRDPRNKNNIVALRGALFMMKLKHEVQSQGYTVAHIKTDSIKIPNATPEIIEFCSEFAKGYGYRFEHEATYEKMCLVNDAVYIAKYKTPKIDKKTGEKIYWTATGTQFQVPYVFKTLFSKKPIEFSDMCETKSASTSLYLDTNENCPDVGEFEELKSIRAKNTPLTSREANFLKQYDTMSDETLDQKISLGHDYHFVGKVGMFTPILKGYGGGELLREKNGKYFAVTGSKGYRWLESETVKNLNLESYIDKNYYRQLVDEAVDSISKYGDFEEFASNNIYIDSKSDFALEPPVLPIVSDPLPDF